MTTTLKEQAWQSGLVLSDETAEWNENNWPHLEGGWRSLHATVVLHHPDKNDDNNNNRRQTVIVLGGWQQGQNDVSSVFVLNLAESNNQWREGPSMNKVRSGHAAVVCNGGVYVMGGYMMRGYNRAYLDCMERIDVSDLLKASLTPSSTHESHWTT